MSRIKIELPAKQLATVEISVRITDINYGNHLGNDAIVGLIHEARMRWLSQHQWTEVHCAGTGLIMAGLAVEFRQEAFYGDVLDVEVLGGSYSRIGFDLGYRITNRRTGAVTALALTNMVCFDYSSRRPAPLPEALQQVLS